MPARIAFLLIALTACASTVAPVGTPTPSSAPPTSSPAVASTRPPPASPTPRAARVPDGDRATVTRVVDGDTVNVDLRGRDVTIRFIGIDTPETVHPRVGVECYGREASRYVKRALDGERVVLVYDVERRDRYGRTLAYLWRVRDALFVNLDLVRRGFATVSTFPPNVAHVDEFVAAQRRAREAGLGLWGACPAPG